eukprot:114009-Pyramimonas_sp.AAC.1
MISIWERSGLLPGQMNVVLLIMLSKPDGGHRPIGLFVSIYRLWARARRSCARQSEADNARGNFCAGAFASSVDTVWRQGVRSEVAVASQDCSSS